MWKAGLGIQPLCPARSCTFFSRVYQAEFFYSFSPCTPHPRYNLGLIFCALVYSGYHFQCHNWPLGFYQAPLCLPLTHRSPYSTFQTLYPIRCCTFFSRVLLCESNDPPLHTPSSTPRSTFLKSRLVPGYTYCIQLSFLCPLDLIPPKPIHPLGPTWPARPLFFPNLLCPYRTKN